MADRHNMDGTLGKQPARRQPASSPGTAGLTLVASCDRQLDTSVLRDMREAALGMDRSACVTVLNAALAAGIARDDLADLYIPELARDMGIDWCTDELSFASVTIGVSRLQAMLRDLGPELAGDHAGNPVSIMLIVGEDVHHTLGAMVLKGQLQRKGLSVRLMLGAPLSEVADRLAMASYDAVFISSSIGETLESLRKIVDVVRSASKKALPVVIGGTILEDTARYDIAALTTADYATNSPSEALELCGLSPKYPMAAPALREV